MNDFTGERRSSSSAFGEEPIETRRYLDALRRSKFLIAGIVIVATAAAVAISLALPKTYQATASIVVDNAASTLGNASGDAISRELATTQSLITTNAVLTEAAGSVPGETRSDLESKVTVSTDPNANIIDITVSDRDPEHAATLATAVAESFLEQQRDIARQRITNAQTALNQEITRLSAQSPDDPDVAAQLRALQARLAELSVASASAGSDLQLVQRPEAPSQPSSPRPLRNAVITFFAALFVAVLIALGREQLRPRVANQRELGQLLGVPVLSGIPYISRRVSARKARAEYETYQSLSAATRLALPPDRTPPHLVLVTSAVHGEGKTTVTRRLGRLLAQAGHPTLVVSADLRSPKLDQAFDVSGMPGVRDLLATVPVNGGVPLSYVEDAIVSSGSNRSPVDAGVDILPAGARDADITGLLTTQGLQSLFESLRELDYTYVIVDSPPILGVADAQLLARFTDDVLLVSRLDRVSTSTVIDLREMLDRIGVDPIGVVVIGARLADSPYYYSAKEPSSTAR